MRSHGIDWDRVERRVALKALPQYRVVQKIRERYNASEYIAALNWGEWKRRSPGVECIVEKVEQ